MEQSTKDRILSETSESIKQKVRETANKLVKPKQETLEEAISKLEGELDKMYIDLYGWVNIEHSICSETI